ncbi:unnamed protein product, partial [Prunus brigantina]
MRFLLLIPPSPLSCCLPYSFQQPRKLTNSNILQVHSIICHDIADADFNKRLLILLIVAIQCQVPEPTHKVHGILTMLLTSVVELSGADSFFMLEILLTKPACQAF